MAIVKVDWGAPHHDLKVPPAGVNSSLRALPTASHNILFETDNAQYTHRPIDYIVCCLFFMSMPEFSELS
jgi:hypothetical protein